MGPAQSGRGNCPYCLFCEELSALSLTAIDILRAARNVTNHGVQGIYGPGPGRRGNKGYHVDHFAA